jgi:hypothetical protein
VAANGLETGGCLQICYERLETGMLDLHFLSAGSADQMVVVMPGDFIDQVPIPVEGREYYIVLGQEFQRAVDSRLGHARDALTRQLINLGRGKVSARLLEDVQDGMTLLRHAEAARLQFIGERFRARHRLLIASFCNKDYKQLSLIVNTGVK